MNQSTTAAYDNRGRWNRQKLFWHNIIINSLLLQC